MLSSGNNLSHGTSTMSSDVPSLTQCLPLEQIALGNQKYTRSGELRRVLGVTVGSASEGYSFGVAHPKPPQPMATEELKHLKESVEDSCKRARDRAKVMQDSLSKLEKYEALNLKKRQRSEHLSNERSNGGTMTKMGNQVRRNTQDNMGQRLEDRAKSVGLNKRVRSSVADTRPDGRSNNAPRQQMNQPDGRSNNAPRQQMVIEKGVDALQDASGDTVRFEEKIRRLPAGGEGWDTKNKKKRSVGVVSGRVINGDRDIKRAMPPKISSDPKLRSCDAQSFRPSNEDNLASGPNTVIKAKVSRAPRTGSIKMLDSSLKVQSSSTSLQGAEKPRSSNKVAVPGVVNNHKSQISAGSSSMAQWVGQRPKNSRTRRANIVAPVSSPADAHISSQGFKANDFNPKTSLITTKTLVANSMGNGIPKFKRERESVRSPFEFSESEESGAGENKPKAKKADSGEAARAATQKVGSFPLPATKNKLPANDIGDGVRRQGRSGRGMWIARPGIHTVREKLENLPTTKPIQHVKAASDKNKSKIGRPPSTKLKDRKSSARIAPLPNTGSLDSPGESDDDREELLVAANSARDASDNACSGPFWKKMESVFGSTSSEDMSYLKQQLSFAEELDESLSQMLGGESNFLEPLEKTSLCGKVDMGSLEKGITIYQRVLCALIEEDENEESYIHGEGKNMLLHYASDDSHCGSCNLIDIEAKDRDRMESEVESEVNFQIQKNTFLDRISCDKSVASSTVRNPSMSSSLHSNERWPGDDEFSHPDIGHAMETCSHDLGQPQSRELYVPCSDEKYQVMSLDDKILLELQSIGLFPESLPDLQEGEDMINGDIMQLKEKLHKQVGWRKRKLAEIDKAVQKGKEVERGKVEQNAMDQLVEIAYRKRLACRGNNSSRSAVRKPPRHTALSFIKRTLDRCEKFEDTGKSCFSEPALQEVMFSTTPCNNDTKSGDCVGSGTASNTCNEVSNHHTEARGSVAVSSSYSHGDYFDGVNKRRKVIIDDAIGCASSRVTSTLNGAVKGQRSDRDHQNKDSIRGNSVSRTSHPPLGDRERKMKMKLKPKPKSTQLLTEPNGHPRGYIPAASNPNNKTDREVEPITRPEASKEADEPMDLTSLPLTELDSIGLEVPNDLGGPQDLGMWLNIDDDDGFQDHDSIGLAVPMDDLTELMLM
ncbi:uncharacterized protein [Euphorbia lathyris]|uniref:uncharacterized protein isoform X2 n=1 Tax=Euphorbia lathyris TaxID=212925 RepID=UPI003313E54F